MQLPSTDGVKIAVHDLGGTGPALLIAHANGFHGRCYIPLAQALSHDAHSVAFDLRGHGDTARPEGDVSWRAYADDAQAIASWLVARGGGPIDAFGHSLGATCLLMVAHRQPGLIRRIVAFEPIVHPSPAAIGEALDDAIGDVENPMVAGARRRRDSFPSYEAALARFSARPPLNAFTPAALEAYVRFGFAEGAGKVHLKCTPDTEASTYATARSNAAWDLLPDIQAEVLVVSGRVEPAQPSAVAHEVAARLPKGRYLQLDELDHFGPMTHPLELAAIISKELAR